jgi:hypothetical protein
MQQRDFASMQECSRGASNVWIASREPFAYACSRRIDVGCVERLFPFGVDGAPIATIGRMCTEKMMTNMKCDLVVDSAFLPVI